jgi:hypothetical protein
MEKIAISVGSVLHALMERSRSPRMFSEVRGLIKPGVVQVLDRVPNPYSTPARTHIEDMIEMITATQKNSFPIEEARILGLYNPPWTRSGSLTKTGSVLTAGTMRAAASLRRDALIEQVKENSKNRSESGVDQSGKRQTVASFAKFIKKEKIKEDWKKPKSSAELRANLNKIFKSSYNQEKK